MTNSVYWCVNPKLMGLFVETRDLASLQWSIEIRLTEHYVRTETIVQHTEWALVSTPASLRTATLLLRQLSALRQLVAGTSLRVSLGGLSEQEERTSDLPWGTTGADGSGRGHAYRVADATQHTDDESPAQADDRAEPPAPQRRSVTPHFDLRSRKADTGQSESVSRAADASSETDARFKQAETASPSTNRLRPRPSAVLNVRRTDGTPARPRPDLSPVSHLRVRLSTASDDWRRGEAAPRRGQPIGSPLRQDPSDNDVIGARSSSQPTSGPVEDSAGQKHASALSGINHEGRNASDSAELMTALRVKSSRHPQQRAPTAFDASAVRQALRIADPSSPSSEADVSTGGASHATDATRDASRVLRDPDNSYSPLDDDVSRLAEQLERLLRDEARRHGIIL